MAGFYMVAGSVLSELSLMELQHMLTRHGIECGSQQDEIRLQSQSRLFLREGFSHEKILVGDAQQLEILRDDCAMLSSVLQILGITHAYDLYDKTNALISEFEFAP